MKMPFTEATFDGAYSIEATCHCLHLLYEFCSFCQAPDRKAIYSEIFRVLKPGSTFAMYEWCMTDKYDPKNHEHNEIKHGVEV